MNKDKKDDTDALVQAGKNQAVESYVLRLFVAGITPKSDMAIRSVKDICEEYLKDRYELDIVDIYQQPGMLKEEQVVVAPTLIKKLPLPLRRLIGNMANTEKVLVGLDLRLRNDTEA